MCGFSASVYSDESHQLVRSQVSDRVDDLYLLESPRLKMLLSERTEHVNPLFGARSMDTEHQEHFQEFLSQPNKFQEHYRMTPQTFCYILSAIEESIKRNLFFMFQKHLFSNTKLISCSTSILYELQFVTVRRKKQTCLKLQILRPNSYEHIRKDAATV